MTLPIATEKDENNKDVTIAHYDFAKQIARTLKPFNKEIFYGICAEMITGGSLTNILKGENKYGIHYHTFIHWLHIYPEARDLYESLNKERALVIGEQIIEELEKTNEQNYNAQRVRLDTLKWMAIKLYSKVFGDKLEVEVKPTYRIGMPIRD